METRNNLVLQTCSMSIL